MKNMPGGNEILMKILPRENEKYAKKEWNINEQSARGGMKKNAVKEEWNINEKYAREEWKIYPKRNEIGFILFA